MSEAEREEGILSREELDAILEGFAESKTADDIRRSLANDSDFSGEYPHATVNTVGEQDAQGRGSTFNVRLKLNDRQRADIADLRKDWRDERDKAVAEGLAPPGAFQPPYVAQLQRVFAGALVVCWQIRQWQ